MSTVGKMSTSPRKQSYNRLMTPPRSALTCCIDRNSIVNGVHSRGDGKYGAEIRLDSTVELFLLFSCRPLTWGRMNGSEIKFGRRSWSRGRTSRTPLREWSSLRSSFSRCLFHHNVIGGREKRTRLLSSASIGADGQ